MTTTFNNAKLENDILKEEIIQIEPEENEDKKLSKFSEIQALCLVWMKINIFGNSFYFANLYIYITYI